MNTSPAVGGSDALGSLEPALFHVLQRFPTRGTGELCPVLFVERGGTCTVHQGAVDWALSRLKQRASRTLFTDLRVLGRLHDFHQIGWKGEHIHDDDRTVFIWSYLDARYHGTALRADLRPLNWAPVSYSSVRNEFRAIARYYEFQDKRNSGAKEGFSTPEVSQQFRTAIVEYAREARKGFLDHLAASRARWAALFGSDHRMPDLGVREAARSGSSFSLDRTIDLEELKLIIRGENNPMYRALWILSGFGGPRISEQLHMWQCDVLPPMTGAHVAGRPQNSLFVVIAHPSESRYLGDFTRLGDTRLQHLANRYGRRPRHHLRGYRYVGWKNPLLTNREWRFSEVFWSDNEQANEFSEAYAEIRHIHSQLRTSERHPYLFINLSKGAGFGEPIAYAKAREAFARACERVGLEPSANGRRIHGMRHAYKHHIKGLGLPAEYIQVAMRHTSRESQEDYGKTTRDIRTFLENALHWGGLE